MASSSSSSSSYDSSSSSSSHDLYYREIRDAIINQNNYNLLPFSLIAESGTFADLDDGRIGFTIEASDSDYMDYEAVINRDNSYIDEEPDVEEESTVYVPEDERAIYKHGILLFILLISRINGKNTSHNFSASPSHILRTI